MSTPDLRGILNRNLDWISAADSKVAPILAIDTAMLGVLAALAPSSAEWSVGAAILAAVASLLLLASLLFLGTAVFPRVDGPVGSLVYFGGITSKDETTYIEALKSASEDSLFDDYARQIHRNAQIAEAKFSAIRSAMIALFLALLPWLVAIGLLYGS